VRLEFGGNRITPDAGLLAYRELGEKLGLTDTADQYLTEHRSGRNVQHHLVALIRQSTYSRLAGCPDTNDADRLARDPTLGLVVSRRACAKQAAARDTVGRFETETLCAEDNRAGLAALNAAWVSTALSHTGTQRLIPDLDSSESLVHGQQEGAKYSGHYGSVCHHPLFCSDQLGDCQGAMQREGNVSGAEGWRELPDPIVERYVKWGLRKQFRGDAGSARPEIHEYLEQHNFLYAIRLPSDSVLEWLIEPYLERPEALAPGAPVELDDFAREAGEDRGPADPSRPAVDPANGRSGCHARLVCTDSQPDQAPQASADLRLALPRRQR